MSFSPVFIDAYDCLSPAGLGLQPLLASLYEGRTHLHEGLGSLPETLDNAIESLRSEKSLKDHDKTTLMAVFLARRLPSLPSGAGVIAGSSRGAAFSIESAITGFREGRRLKSSTSPVTTASSLPSALARDLKLSGPSFYLSAACSTGLYAVIQGAASIQASLAEAFLVGGVEAANTDFTREMMAATKVTSLGLEPFPCKPGAEDRSGMILSEGAAFLHLSREKTMKSRAEILGFGAATESSTLTGVSENGDALQQAIEKALSGAGLKAFDIDLIVGHGAGTLKGDEAELNAYSHIFQSQMPPLVFHKWCGGHMLGASAALSVMLAIEHLKAGETSPHPYLPNAHLRREKQPLGKSRLALITSMGFGGSACAVIVKKLMD